MKYRDLNILLVDDDLVDVMNVQRAFKKNGITNEVAIAENGLEALDKLKNNDYSKPCLIFLDINMPKMNGIEFLEELRKDPLLKNNIVIILTTSNDQHDIISAYNYNVAGYILKPLSFNDFVDVINVLDNYWLANQIPTLN